MKKRMHVLTGLLLTLCLLCTACGGTDDPLPPQDDPGEGLGGGLTEDDEPDWNGSLNGDPDSYWSWDSDLCQRNVAEFEGIWYYEGDLSAETYIVIDENGN